MEKEDDYFVGIYEPLDVRRNLLESSKEIIKSLQANENLQRTREMKLRLYREMKRIMEELDLLISKLSKRLPKSGLRKALENDSKKISHRVIQVNNPKFNSELEKLEQQLRNVEKDLSSFK
jgi:hypothetical protein